tara:strand:+ start:67 stop:210 length:144 start_codon:yes stop_codon:yes gene_type:complete
MPVDYNEKRLHQNFISASHGVIGQFLFFAKNFPYSQQQGSSNKILAI